MKLLSTHVQVLGVVAMVKYERQGRSASFVGSSLQSSLLISKLLLIFIVGRKQKDHTPRSLDYCLFAPHWVLFFAIPFQRLYTNGPFEMCLVRMFLKQRQTHNSSSYLPGKKIFMLKQKLSHLYMICSNSVK